MFIFFYSFKGELFMATCHLLQDLFAVVDERSEDTYDRYFYFYYNNNNNIYYIDNKMWVKNL